MVLAYDIDFGTSSSSPMKPSSTCTVCSASDLCPARAENSTPQAGTLLGRRRHQLSQVGWLTKWCCLRIEFPHRRPSRVGRWPVHHAGFRVSRTCRSADADNLEQLYAWYPGYLQLMTTHPLTHAEELRLTYPGVDGRVATESGASDTFDRDAWMPVCFLDHTALCVALARPMNSGREDACDLHFCMQCSCHHYGVLLCST